MRFVNRSNELDRVGGVTDHASGGLAVILDVVGMGAHRVVEIAGRLATPSPSLSRPLQDGRASIRCGKDTAFA